MPLPCAHARKTLVKVLKYMYIVLDGDNRVARRTASQDGTSRSTVAPATLVVEQMLTRVAQPAWMLSHPSFGLLRFPFLLKGLLTPLPALPDVELLA